MSAKDGLRKGISIVLFVNIINLVFKLITNFLMPKYLTVDCYADFKYYQLFIGYLGIMHFGFVDGVYLQYGGKTIDEIPENQLEKSLAALISLEAVVTVAVGAIALLLNNMIIFAVAFAILPTEAAWFYKYVYQATGEFSKYGRIMNVNTILVFILELLLILCGVQNAYYYIAANTAALLIVWILLERKARIHYQKQWFGAKNVVRECKDNIPQGIFVMAGNFASQFLTSMDRWFIKVLMDATAFAQYSFAASIVVFMNVAVTPFSITFYNHFCKHNDTNTVKRIEGAIYLLATGLIALAFPVKWILEHFIPNYIDATAVIFYLFAAQGFSIIISCIYVNLYKATKTQKSYSIKMGIMIVIGFLLNAGMYYVMRTKESFAIATLITTAIWYLMSQADFPQYIAPAKSQFFLVLEIVVFLYVGITFNSIFGVAIYLACLAIGIAIFMRDEFKTVISMISLRKRRT